MIKIKTFLINFGISVTFISCVDDPKIIQEFTDDFSTHTTNWSRIQVSDSSRYALVDNPLNNNDKSLKFYLYPDDFNAGGKRNEYFLKTKDSISRRVNYSFKFMVSDAFFESKKNEQDWIIIHQWHDDPPLGMTWKEYKMLTKPPISLFIHVNPSKEYSLNYTYGLQNKDKNNTQFAAFTEPLQPNKWYTFSNTIKWSLNDNNGYSIPKVNDVFLVDSRRNEEHKLIGDNMFNTVPNYYKMGLYGNYKSNDTISIYFDDFQYTLYEK